MLLGGRPSRRVQGLLCPWEGPVGPGRSVVSAEGLWATPSLPSLRAFCCALSSWDWSQGKPAADMTAETA